MSSARPLFLWCETCGYSSLENASPCIPYPCLEIPFCSCDGEGSFDLCVYRPCDEESLTRDHGGTLPVPIASTGNIKELEAAPHSGTVHNQAPAVIVRPPITLSQPELCANCGPPPPGEDCRMWSPCYTEPPTMPGAIIPFCECGREVYEPCIPIPCNEAPATEDLPGAAGTTKPPTTPTPSRSHQYIPTAVIPRCECERDTYELCVLPCVN